MGCGSEHTVALAGQGTLYSWGQGEGGLLGHGNTESLASPKRIEALKNVEVASVICGGLHTMALTKQGTIYSWGNYYLLYRANRRIFLQNYFPYLIKFLDFFSNLSYTNINLGRAEGGQLGLPFEELHHEADSNELYLTVPKQVKGSLVGVKIIQVASGDAHSLALNDKGQVYGWGYTNSGQLGLGITGDNFDQREHSTLQVKEPALLKNLAHMKIKEIYAGSTFSLFLNEKKELLGCGLNDYNQLGIEKTVTKINNNLENYRHASSHRTTESPVPKLIDCFTCMPVHTVACGENHSLAVKNYYYFNILILLLAGLL